MAGKLIFFLEIKPPGHDDDSRIAADGQMRNIFHSLYDLTPLPTLHSISPMGPRLAFYCLDKAAGNIDPEYVEWSRSCIRDGVPANRWHLNIMTAVGYERFMEVVNDVSVTKSTPSVTPLLSTFRFAHSHPITLSVTTTGIWNPRMYTRIYNTQAKDFPLLYTDSPHAI